MCFFRLSENEDLIEAIRRRAEESNVKAGILILIGSLSNVVMGFYRNGKYELTRLNGPLEIASCMGNIAVDEKGEVIIHSHIVVSNEKCEAFGGHLMKESHVGVTAELVIIEGSDVELQRAFNKETKLNLLQL
jgi:predicted DNA-binding protein with PD1-like motif